MRAQAAFIGGNDESEAFGPLLRDLLSLSGSEIGFLCAVESLSEDRVAIRMLAVAGAARFTGERATWPAMAALVGRRIEEPRPPLGRFVRAAAPVVLNGAVLAHDVAAGMPGVHPVVERFLGLPMWADGRVVAFAGLANRPGGYPEELVSSLAPLTTAVAQLLSGLEARRLKTAWEADMAEREAAHRRVAATLRSVLDYAPLGIWLLNDSGKLELVNEAFCRAVGIPEDEFVAAADYGQLLPANEAQACRGSDAIAFERGAPHTSVEAMRFVDGELHELEIVKVPFVDEAGNLRLVGMSTDVTARRVAEARVRQLAAVFENAREGIVLTSLDGAIREVNRSYCTITGYTPEQLVGANPRIIKSGRHDSEFYEAMFVAIRSTGYWHGEIWNRRRNGEVYPAWVSITTMYDEAGNPDGYVSVVSDITEVKAQQVRLEHLAYHDSLTHLPNRTLLADRLAMAQHQAARGGTLVAVCFLDLDGFKPINDAHGHDVGDGLLCEVARRLSDSVRAGDTVARIGGDEFVLLLANVRSAAEVDATVTRVLATLARPVEIDGRLLQVTASVGVTVYPNDPADADTLLRHADQALYVAKERGKNRAHHFDVASDRRGRARQEDLSRFAQAIRTGELCLHYQPVVELGTGRLASAEALLRWRHPQRGLLAPGQFLASVEGTELDVALGEWVFHEALTQLTRWRELGFSTTIGVNVSPHHLAQRNFADRLAGLIGEYGAGNGAWLELEIVESGALGDLAGVSETMYACRELGVEFAVDDFGTGYSSLTYLKRLPAHTLKIDQSFVRDMMEDHDDLAIVQGVIGLAQAFARRSVAEGIETLGHGVRLISLGCGFGQGYYIARPMPAAALPGWASQWRAPADWVQAARGQKRSGA